MKKFNEILDSIFQLLLLIAVAVSIVVFFIKVFFTEDEMISKLIYTAFSTSGISGSAYLYMRWNALKRTKIKLSDLEDISKITSDKNE